MAITSSSLISSSPSPPLSTALMIAASCSFVIMVFFLLALAIFVRQRIILSPKHIPLRPSTKQPAQALLGRIWEFWFQAWW